MGSAPELRPVAGRPPLPEYLRQLWRRRHFIIERAWSQATTSNRGFVLGNLWLILNPLLDAAIYMAIFGFLFKPAIENFSEYLIIGIFMFSISSSDVTAGAGSISASSGLIKAFMFPRAAIPLASVIRNMIQTIPTMLVLLTMIVIIGGLPGPALLLAPAIYTIQVIFNTGLAFIAARLGHDFPDSRRLISILFRILLYGSGVMFSAQRYEAIPSVAAVVHHNPFFNMLMMYRDVMMYNTVPPASEWLEFTLWALGTLALGLWFFWRAEESYGRPE